MHGVLVRDEIAGVGVGLAALDVRDDCKFAIGVGSQASAARKDLLRRVPIARRSGFSLVSVESRIVIVVLYRGRHCGAGVTFKRPKPETADA